MSIFETTYSDAGEYTFVAGRNRSSVILYVNGMWPHNQCFHCFYYSVVFWFLYGFSGILTLERKKKNQRDNLEYYQIPHVHRCLLPY